MILVETALELDLLIKHKYQKRIQLIGEKINVSYVNCR